MVSLLAMLYFFRTHQILLYGDAVAHLNIARRVTDSITPGFRQLGTVWLPLPHILSLPFVFFDKLWQSGIGGSFVSMAAYVLATVGIFRFTYRAGSRAAAWIATLIFAANPNLLYMQSTAMTESLFLATVIWSVIAVAEFSRAARAADLPGCNRAMRSALLWLSAAMLTRYDGWFLAGCAFIALVLIALRSPGLRGRLRKPLLKFALLCSVVPVLWLSYNYALYHNPLEFANGPYSAKGIEQRTASAGGPPHPGYHDLWVAEIFFAKSAQLNTGEGRWQHVFLVIAIVAAVLSCFRRDQRPGLLLWALVPFYAYSIAYGGVPIFMPQWWPHSYYNVRYGLQLLPAIAVFTSFAYEFARQMQPTPLFQRLVFVAFVLLIAGTQTSVWHAVPICLREARVNAVTREGLENALAAELSYLPPGSRLLMYTGDYVGALQKARVHLARAINEGNFRIWKRALQEPAKSADYIIAVRGDPVDAAVHQHPEGLTTLAVVHSRGKPPATIYRSDLRPAGLPPAR